MLVIIKPLYSNGKKKLSLIVTQNPLEFIIEYTLISSILERICEMTKKPLEYPRYNTKLDPLRHLLKIRTWGIEWKKVIDKTVEWVAWRWVNAKMDKKSLSIMKQNVNISKDDMEDYNLAMFTHAMEFFKEHVSLKKLILEYFFTSLLNDLSTEDLINIWEFTTHRIHESSTMTLHNSR
jgi:hypothetical protein